MESSPPSNAPGAGRAPAQAFLPPEPALGVPLGRQGLPVCRQRGDGPSVRCPLRECGASAHPASPLPPRVSQEMNIQELTNYRKSVMSLAEAGKLYRKDLEIVLCGEAPL